MNILLISNLYPPQELGGYGRCMADFAWGLLQRGHNLRVLSSDAPYLGAGGPGPNQEAVSRQLQLKGSFEGGVQLLQDPLLAAGLDRHNRAAFHAELAAAPVDAVLLGNLDLLGVELLQTLLEAGVPVVHHVGFVAPPFAARQWPSAKHYKLICASQAVRLSLLQAGLPVQEASVVYPGARIDRISPGALRSCGSSPLGSPAQPLKICFAGLLMASKGAHTVVEAAAQLHQRGLHVQVNLAGSAFEPSYWERLQAFAQQCGLTGVVRWVGSLPHDQLVRFLGIHHVGVFPSIYPEAFGIVAAEMQARGLALISSGVGGAAELVEPDISGLLFQPGNADDLARQLLRLINEPGLLEQLQQRGRERVRDKFSVSQAAAQLERLLAS